MRHSLALPGRSLLERDMHRTRLYACCGKRMLDIVIAAVALVVFAPVLLAVALLVRVKLGSPVLFRQRRPGRGGVLFDLVKFRTMTDARDARGELLPDDERLTRFGKFLRSTSLDELPELFNILRGDMSVVGPRPLLEQYLPWYTPREQTRHDVRPGLTGWAQINGRVNVPWDEGLEMDAWYVENMSLWLDLKIMWGTFWKVVRRDNVHPSEGGARPNLDDERRLRLAPPLADSAGASEIQMLSVKDESCWREVLACLKQHDVYHLFEYHRLAEQHGEGRARLWVYREGEFTLALPLLLRPLDGESWLGNGDREWQDATSVYGYAGPLASHDDVPRSVIERFHQSLTVSLRRERVVSVFSRLHPLLRQTELLREIGQCAVVGQTVSIDLTRTPEEIERSFDSSHRRDLRRLRAELVQTHVDKDWMHLDEFISIYRETMSRVQASSSYFFDRGYFEAMVREMDGHCQLHVVTLGGKMIAGGLFLSCGKLLHYHLSGTASEFLNLSPAKLLVADAAQWGRQNGFRRLHLGGGLGGKQDLLFRFKAGFSDDHHDFLTWRWVLDGREYERLCRLKESWNGSQGLRVTAAEYFPAFRSPVETVST